MKVYVLTRATYTGYHDSFEIVAVYANETTARQEAQRRTEEVKKLVEKLERDKDCLNEDDCSADWEYRVSEEEVIET